MSTELWERWVGSTTPPQTRVQRGATIREVPARTLTTASTLPGVPDATTVITRRWITFRDEINGQQVIVDMPDNALTGHCDHGRHDSCAHRLGGPAEGGIVLKLGLPGFVWRCGCPCHCDPTRVGRLF